MASKVALIKTNSEYPKPPFNPPIYYPEFPFGKVKFDRNNKIYDAVRHAFYLLGFDRKNFGKKTWNPLGEIIKPGDNVLIKPNFVVSSHRDLGEDKDAILCTDTHASIIRPLIDYSFIACGPHGRITIADSPILSENFEKILDFTDTKRMVTYLKQFKNLKIDIIDLRNMLYIPKDYYDSKKYLIKNKGDPLGYIIIDLGKNSELFEIREFAERFRFPGKFDYNFVFKHHTKEKNEYSIARTVLNSDCVISVPKLKTHYKAGVTLSLKNMIGITNKKEWLPHHREGTKKDGGDETPFPFTSEYKIKQKIINIFKKLPYGVEILLVMKKIYNSFESKEKKQDVITEGRWYGNDTIWRTTLDMNRILFYADKNGRMCKKKQRTYLSVIDGIIGGHKNGPLKPTPISSGIIIMGTDPVACDVVATRSMGFSHDKIPTIMNASKKPYFLGTNKIKDIRIVSNLREKNINLNFIPPHGWECLKC